MVEAMELLEMYCDLLLARFGMIETMKLVKNLETFIFCTAMGSLQVLEQYLIIDLENYVVLCTDIKSQIPY